METRMKTAVYRIIAIAVSLILTVSALPASIYLAEGGAIIVNGDFENGTAGFENINAALFEVIAETGNPANHVLHLKGGGKYKQTVTVKKNTDYIWTFRMKKLESQLSVYFDVIAEDGTTNLITAVVGVSSGGYSNMYNGRAAVNVNRDTWGTFSIKFNSGNNTSVALTGDTWTANREYYTDDWTITEEIKTGAVVNGEFDSGTKGYTNVDTATFEVIPEPGNETNNLLHLIGGGSYYQQVKVNKNTDYIWTFRMKDLGSTESTRILVTAADSENSLMSDIMQSGGGYASLNDGGYASVAAYNKAWVTFTVRFNSGDNESIKLIHNTYASDREIYTDDWRLSLEPKGDIINGDFENGTVGYTDGGVSAFEVIREPGNTANRVLHLVGGGSYWQTVKVNKNTDYIWTFRMKDIGNTGSTRILVTAEDGDENLITEFTKDGNGYASLNDGTYAAAATYGKNWVTFTAKFNSGDNENVRLSHNTWAASREIYMDDWNLDRAALPGELRNGGFEDGLKYFAVDGNTSAEITKEDVYDGAYSAKVNGKDNSSKPAFGRFIYQEVTVKPNTDYIWSFWYKSKAHNTSLVGVRSADDKLLLPSFLKTDAYAAESNRSFTDIRSASDINLWHETLYDTDWKQYNVIFNSGENTSVRLSIDLINSARGGFTDNWALGEYTFMRGDADNDGTVDSKDLVEIRRRLLGIPTYYMGGIDVNNDGKFNIADLIRLKKDLTSASPIEGYSLVWSDEFTGTALDSEKWTRAQHMSGKSDLELRYDDTGISVENGEATLYAGRVDENNYYTNAALTTCNRDGTTHLMSFKYGYVEMRAKIPFGAPAFPSFWMKSLVNNGVHGEIDIFEHFCYNENGDTWIQSGIHKWYTEAGTHLLLTEVGDKAAINGMNVAADGDWHTYGLLWTPEKLEFICDGTVYHSIDITGIGTYKSYNTQTGESTGITEEDFDVFHDYYYLIMNNYMHTPAGTGGADYAADSSTVLPLKYEIDYVRLYQNSDGSIRIGAL